MKPPGFHRVAGPLFIDTQPPRSRPPTDVRKKPNAAGRERTREFTRECLPRSAAPTERKSLSCLDG